MKIKNILICLIILILIATNIFTIWYYFYKEKTNEVVDIEPVDIYGYENKVDKYVLSSAMEEYCSLNNAVDKNMVNILALADLQYLGDYETEDYDLDMLLKRIETISKLDNMDLAVSIGDLGGAKRNVEDSIKNLKTITSKMKKLPITTLFTLGNHDRFIYKEPEHDMSKEDYFNITFDNIDSSYKFNENVENEPYYYKDIENKKMRICVLNCLSAGNCEYVIDEEQLKFVAERMLDFSDKEYPSEWTVAFFIHTLYPTDYHKETVEGADILIKILSHYKKGDILNEKNINVDYSSIQRANIAAIFTGHHHVGYTLEKDGIQIIGIDSVRTANTRSSIERYIEYSDWDSDISFEIISIDTNNRKIYSTKVGNGQNRYWNY